MKYGYRFSDWGIFFIDEILETQTLDHDILWASGEVRYKADEWCYVRTVEPIFIVPKLVNGKYKYEHSNVGVYFKKHIFETREQAENYGKENSQSPLR